jgi:hypothetical protein
MHVPIIDIYLAVVKKILPNAEPRRGLENNNKQALGT